MPPKLKKSQKKPITCKNINCNFPERYSKKHTYALLQIISFLSDQVMN